MNAGQEKPVDRSTPHPSPLHVGHPACPQPAHHLAAPAAEALQPICAARNATSQGRRKKQPRADAASYEPEGYGVVGPPTSGAAQCRRDAETTIRWIGIGTVLRAVAEKSRRARSLYVQVHGEGSSDRQKAYFASSLAVAWQSDPGDSAANRNPSAPSAPSSARGRRLPPVDAKPTSADVLSSNVVLA